MVPGVPASQWQLSGEGCRRSELLAGCLAAYGLSSIVTSIEPKAMETGQIVARILGIPYEVAPGLHEHERGVVKLVDDKKEFQARVLGLFERPGELVFGGETADEAHGRFARAVANVLEQYPTGNLAIVTHGTVLTLFVSRAADLKPGPFWQRLGLPCFAVLSLPDFDLLELVEDVGGEM
jgi:broad specificity phosphatase PhoE